MFIFLSLLDCIIMVFIYNVSSMQTKISIMFNSTKVIAKIKEMPKCIWNSKPCQLHVNFMFQMWCWPCIFCISMSKIIFRSSVAVSLCYNISLIRIGNQRNLFLSNTLLLWYSVCYYDIQCVPYRYRYVNYPSPL